MYPGAHAKTQPDKPALIMAGTGRTITFAELDERSNRLAQWWYAAGLRTGDGVAMLVTNIPETLEIYWAAIRSGLYVTAINYNDPRSGAVAFDGMGSSWTAVRGG